MNSVPNSEIDYIKYIIPRNSYSTYHPFLSTGERYIPLGTTDAFYFQPGTSRVKASTESPSTTQPRESISHDCHGYVKSAAQIVRPASSKSTQIASKNENVPFFPPSKKFPPRGQSQFTEENAYCKNNPFVFRGRTQTAGRMQNKLNRSGFDMDEVKASFVLPGPYFEKTIAVDEQELFLYRVELFVSVESFDKCNFEGPTMELIANRGLTQMTAIQKYAIPLLMARENYNTTRALLVRSPSGSGKTLAVALPIISRIFHMKNKDITKKGPFAVFLAHNNIACAQLCKELLAICPDGGPIKVGMSCGSQDPKVINRLIEEGVDILVCTSGRADNHFFRCAGGSVRELQIQRIRYLVLDEADIFLNFNRFYRYVDPIFQKLKATNGKIKLICLTSCYQSVNRFKQLLPEDAKLGIVSVGTETIPPTVRMKCFNITGQHKHDALISLLKNTSLRDAPDRPPKTIIFVKENDRCAQLAYRLKREGYLAKEIASQDSTNEMLKTMNSFLQGDYDIIVTQDLMARMINVPDLKVVVHYDICEENNHHNILSSCGRVGRLGNIGYCFIFYDRKTDLLAVDALRKLRDRMSFTDEMNSVVAKWKILGVDDRTIIF